jgi:hypothetical protein
VRWLMWGGCYLACHLLLYATVLRTLAAFSRETVIFRYHMISVIVVGSVVTVAAATSSRGVDLATAVGVLSLHGIYSMSFLELWSLAQGGYSLSILEEAGYGGPTVESKRDVSILHQIGASKTQNRLDTLARLGLIRGQGGVIALTLVGRLVAGALWIFARVLNLRQPV